MSLPSITPNDAKRLVDRGALLVDIREASEHAQEHIPGAHLMPLSALDRVDLSPDKDQTVVFHCRSGARTQSNAARLARKAGSGKAFVLDGGISNWKRAGLPTVVGQSEALHSRRKVQIVAGIGGAALGFLVSPWFFAVPAAVAAGLVMAGIARTRDGAGGPTGAPENRGASTGQSQAPTA
jgi:rhodanese-related sulfurtransferase